ncbi:MAG: glycoside hydrolase family 95 protein [Bacteroidota bacterium]
MYKNINKKCNQNASGRRIIFVAVFILYSCLPSIAQQKRMLLWFDKPAYQPSEFTYNQKVFKTSYYFEDRGWNEALPVGNGRLGGMVFGGVLKERIQLNEESLWDGYQRDAVNPKAGKALPEIQRLLFAEQNDSAEALAASSMISIPKGIRPYQSLGDLLIDFKNTNSDTVYSNYKRWLSLDSAVAITQFTYHGVHYRREVFASHPDQVMMVKITCDKPGAINLRVRLLREQDAATTNSILDAKRLIMTGRINCLNDETKQPVGMSFESHVKAINTGGKVTVSNDGEMEVTGANELILMVAAATSYAGKNPQQLCEKNISRAVKKTNTQLFKAHIKDYQSLYNRVKINLDSSSNPLELSQDKRLERVQKNNYEDPYLSELLFQYGRYLLIASSRKGDLPANLQGLWNQKMNPPWSADYHININLQMNYMASEVVNLAECHQPLFVLMDSLMKHGMLTAKEMYHARGWVVHHLTDVFWRTAPADDVPGLWPMGQGWLCHHVYDHYLFSKDKTFLRNKAFPLMKGAAEFYLDFLKPIPAGLPMAGKLVTNPSHSPENAFEKPDGKQSQFTYGATMDLEICHELFKNCLKAIDDLSTPQKPFEPLLKIQLEQALNNLAPIQISKRTGGIQEWIEDYKEPEIGHRHISHLYALFPSSEISIETPELYAAARKTLERRLAGNSNAEVEEAKNRYKSYGSYLGGKSFGGWLSNWVSLMWLRLGEAEEAYKHHQYQLKYGLKANFFGEACQLDATFGSSAVIAEMLLQSHTSTINLLPALPNRWHTGSVTGLKARGDFEINMKWKGNKLTAAKIISGSGTLCRLKINVPVKIFQNGVEIRLLKNAENIITFNTQKGAAYEVRVY